MNCVRMTQYAILVQAILFFRTAIAEQKPRVYYYVKDHLGSTRMVIDREKAAEALNAQPADFDPNQKGIVEVASYYPFGKEMPGKGGMVGSKTTSEKFTGKELDDEGQIDWDGDGDYDLGEQGLDLSYFGARFYDAEIGRWVVRDPAEQHFDLYLYGSNNPVNRFDPDGNVDIRSLMKYLNIKGSQPLSKGAVLVAADQIRKEGETISKLGMFPHPIMAAAGAVGDGIILAADVVRMQCDPTLDNKAETVKSGGRLALSGVLAAKNPGANVAIKLSRFKKIPVGMKSAIEFVSNFFINRGKDFAVDKIVDHDKEVLRKQKSD